MRRDHAGNERAVSPAAPRDGVLHRPAVCATPPCGSFEADDVTGTVKRRFGGRVQFDDGIGETAPGIAVRHVGGHTAAAVPVMKTRRGTRSLDIAALPAPKPAFEQIAVRLDVESRS
jgi:hypothetical protein